MRNILQKSLVGTAMAMLPASVALAEPPGNLKLDQPVSSDKLLPLKSNGGGNPCAALGPGFVKIDGTGTCVKLGGAVSGEAVSRPR
jgi:hypothetical protein